MSKAWIYSMFFYMMNLVIIVNIIYKRKTLYVYLKEDVDDLLASKIEDRVNNIMGLYSIDKLIIDSSGKKVEHLKDFEARFNASHKSKMVIK